MSNQYVKATAYFKDKGREDKLNISVPFNGHLDDTKALRKAAMQEVGLKVPHKKGTVQRFDFKR